MKNIEALFPGTRQVTYLNTPAVGLLSQPVHAFRVQQLDELYHKGSRYFERNFGVLDEVRESIAEAFNTDPARTALMPAFTFGQNAIMESIAPGSKILLLKEDYPSVNKAVESRDFDITYATIDAHLEANIQKEFEASQPDVFVFSIVQYLNGIKIDLAMINALKERYPETLFIADGTQYLGQERFDFKASGIDILGASSYKWINAGFGNAFFTFKPGVEEKIAPKLLGFGSTMGKYKEAGDTLIGRFEGSHLDNANLGSIAVGLRVQQEVGLAEIETKVSALAASAKEEFTALGLLEEAVMHRDQHSPIFNLKGDEALFNTLEQHDILTSQRGAGIRVGFHYYNSWDDLEKLLAVLRAS